MEKQSFLHTIVSQVTAIVNGFAYNRITRDSYLDPEEVLREMKAYGDSNLGAYATRTLFGAKKHSFI